MPSGQSRFFSDVLEYDWTIFDEAPGRDGTLFGIKDGRKNSSRGRAALLSLRARIRVNR